ncbi:hypothetical protein X777_05748 [Ooceraea biroi]|nr:hypothetical protein X777_05748 [Ooceraea biroi]
MAYTNAEMADIHLVLGECRGNGRAAVRRYYEKFPNRRLTDRRTFLNADRHLRESGCFRPLRSDAGRPRTTRTEEMEERVLDLVAAEPSTSTRRVGLQVQEDHKAVWRVWHEQQLYLYHLQKVQGLQPGDAEHRLVFCRWLLRKCAMDSAFLASILWTDEACFTRDGIVNLHNLHEWAEEQPHALREAHNQRQFSINVWAEIMGYFLLGPYELPPRLTGAGYLNFLQNQLDQLLMDALDDVPLAVRRRTWFMHDGAPPHFSVDIRQWLDRRFPYHWVGRGPDTPIP